MELLGFVQKQGAKNTHITLKNRSIMVSLPDNYFIETRASLDGKV